MGIKDKRWEENPGHCVECGEKLPLNNLKVCKKCWDDNEPDEDWEFQELTGEDAKYNDIIYGKENVWPIIGFNEWLELNCGYTSLDEIRETASSQKWGEGEAQDLINRVIERFRTFIDKYHLDGRY